MPPAILSSSKSSVLSFHRHTETTEEPFFPLTHHSSPAYDPEAPYALINHLGLSRLSLITTDLDADMVTLAAAGVAFLSEPVTIDRPVANSRLIYFRDPDGTLIELIELGDAVPGAPNSGGTHITGSLQTTVNCSDFELSRAFYEMVGLTTQAEIEYTGSPELAAAMGLDSFHVREATMTLDKGSGFTLTKWEEPYEASPPYAHLNHLGIPVSRSRRPISKQMFKGSKSWALHFTRSRLRPHHLLTLSPTRVSRIRTARLSNW